MPRKAKQASVKKPQPTPKAKGKRVLDPGIIAKGAAALAKWRAEKAAAQKAGPKALKECQHNGHYHVVHDCSDGRNGCRCARLQSWRLEFGKQRSRRIVRTATVTSEYWENITNYFQNGERKIIHLEIAGREWISSDSTGRIRLQECYRQGRIKLDTLCNNSLNLVRNNIAWHIITICNLYQLVYSF